jgi:hypothetical protein
MTAKITTIEKFDAGVCKDLRPIIEQAINGVLRQRGLNGTLGNIRFTDTSFEVKLEVKAANNGRACFEQYSHSEGLKNEWFGQPFKDQGQTLRITGWAEGRKIRTHPVQVTDDNGQTFLLTAQAVKDAFLPPVEAAKELEESLRTNWTLGYWQHGLAKGWLDQELKDGETTVKIIGLKKIGRKAYVALEKPNNDFAYLEVKTFLNFANSAQNRHLRHLQEAA